MPQNSDRALLCEKLLLQTLLSWPVPNVILETEYREDAVTQESSGEFSDELNGRKLNAVLI